MNNTQQPIFHEPSATRAHPVWNDYALAFAAVALMFALRWALTPIVGLHYPFATFYFGIVFISMRYGIKPALLALLISFPLATYCFAGNHTLLPRALDEGIGNLFILLNSGTVILLAHKQHRVYAQLAEKEETTRHHAEALEQETQARQQLEAERERTLAQVGDANVRLRRAMQETHHRVKNNLQVVSALVEMQADPDFPPAALASLNRIGQHVRTLAAVHDILTLQARSDSEVTHVPVKAIVTRLLNLVETTLNGRAIKYEVDELWLSAEQAASLGLLVNELVNNAVKHGGRSIQVTLRHREGMAHLEVCDDGPGFPDNFDPRRAAHTGMELIESMGQWDLHGTVTYGNHAEGGAQVQVVFPLPELGKNPVPPSKA